MRMQKECCRKDKQSENDNMKYYIDTEFLEGTQTKRFLGFKTGVTAPTIELISIALVDENNRTFYEVSKEFNVREAWERTQTDESGKIEYWIRDNVLRKIFDEFLVKYLNDIDKAERIGVYGLRKNVWEFTQANFIWLLKKYGSSRSHIANGICGFIYGFDCGGSGMSAIEMAYRYEISDRSANPVFIGYYCDYDWVVFCWLFGHMMSLPKGFPKYCVDLKQTLDAKAKIKAGSGNHHQDQIILIKELGPKLVGEHSALPDAIWNKKFDAYLKTV